MSHPQPLVAVIILNWNGLDDTLECLQSLRESTYPNLRIIVWDNGSRDDPTPGLAAFPEVDLLRSDQNVGFAAGCNRAGEHALHAGADYLLFLNNDTIVPPEMIERMVLAHREAPQAGLISVPECLHDRQDAPRRLGARWHPLQCRSRWIAAPAEELLPQWLPFDIISGCSMLQSRQLAEQVQLFDEQFFAYCEDGDLSLRIQEAGYTNYCVTDTCVIHKSGRSTGRARGPKPAQLYLVCRAQVLMIYKHARGLGRIIGPLRIAASAAIALLRLIVQPHRRRLMRAKLAGFRDGCLRRPVDKSWLP